MNPLCQHPVEVQLHVRKRFWLMCRALRHIRWRASTAGGASQNALCASTTTSRPAGGTTRRPRACSVRRSAACGLASCAAASWRWTCCCWRCCGGGGRTPTLTWRRTMWWDSRQQRRMQRWACSTGRLQRKEGEVNASSGSVRGAESQRNEGVSWHMRLVCSRL